MRTYANFEDHSKREDQEYRNGASDYGIEMGQAVRICLWIKTMADVTSACSSAYVHACSEWV